MAPENPVHSLVVFLCNPYVFWDALGHMPVARRLVFAWSSGPLREEELEVIHRRDLIP